MTYKLATRRFAYDALEQHVDAETMELHHATQLQLHVDNVNKVIASSPERPRV